MRRVVLFRKKPEASEGDFRAAIAGLEALDEKMGEMSTWWVSCNPGVTDMWDAALVADFLNADVCRDYEVHPQHVAAAAVVGMVSEFAVFDSE